MGLSWINTWAERTPGKQNTQNGLEHGTVDLKKGHEYASNIFNAVFGDHTPFFFNGNLKNHGYITNIKQDVCVEVPSVATEAGIVPIRQITLPRAPGCYGK